MLVPELSTLPLEGNEMPRKTTVLVERMGLMSNPFLRKDGFPEGSILTRLNIYSF